MNGNDLARLSVQMGGSGYRPPVRLAALRRRHSFENSLQFSSNDLTISENIVHFSINDFDDFKNIYTSRLTIFTISKIVYTSRLTFHPYLRIFQGTFSTIR